MLRISLAIISIAICGANLPGADKSPANDSPSQEEIFDTKKVWDIHLTFTAEQWEAMEPTQGERGERRPGQSFLLGPEGGRNGLASAFGWQFDYVRADLEFGTNRFAEVGVRYKGNGTFFGSRESLKRSLKIDLNQFVKGQKFVGMSQLSSKRVPSQWMNRITRTHWKRKPKGTCGCCGTTLAAIQRWRSMYGGRRWASTRRVWCMFGRCRYRIRRCSMRCPIRRYSSCGPFYNLRRRLRRT
jgi:hypothetical protein